MMSDLTLSQDEIDALLTGGSGGGADMGGSMGGGAPASSSGLDLQSFKNLLTPLVGAQGANLSSMMSGQDVTISAPEVALISKETLQGTLPEEVVEIRVDFSDGIPGEHAYLFSGDDALKIASPMVGQEGLDLNEAAIAAVGEAASLLTGSAVTSLSDQSGKNISPAPPEGQKVPKAMVRFPEGDFVQATYNVQIGADSLTMIEIFDLAIVNELVAQPDAAPLAGGGDPMAGMGQPQGQPQQGMNQMGMNQQGMNQMGMNQMGMNQMGMNQMNMNQMGMNQMGQMPMMGGFSGAPTNVQGVQFPTLSPTGFQGDQGNIGLLMDVQMEVTVELGRAKRSIKDILGMGEGTIIALDKLAGEPVDILVNHKLIAKGEVVVIDENFGVRVTEIVNQVEKLSDSM